MTIVFVLVPVTLILVGVGLWAFFWAVRTGQFEELDVASWDILADDQRPDELPQRSSRS